MKTLARGLALAFLDGGWDEDGLLERGRDCLRARPRWLRPLCRRTLRAFPSAPAGRLGALTEFIRNDETLGRKLAEVGVPPVRRWFFPPPQMAEVAGRPADFDLPPIESTATLARWLGLAAAELDWFADLARLNAGRIDDRLRHYDFRFVSKRSGGCRLLEIPRPRLKRVQRRLLDRLISRIPPHPAAHGFVRGRGFHAFASEHSGQRVVLRLDLEDFFSSIGAGRVRATLARVGYPDSVAHTIAGLTTLPTPEDVLRRFPRDDLRARQDTIQRLRARHLPQGAPSSPALSNLAVYRLDQRLCALARSMGARYGRYADDLAFSGGADLAAHVEHFIPLVGSIVIEEGFALRYRKVRVMRAGRRQQLGGLVVNRAANVTRREYDRLRAILHNAERTGGAAQNRTGHPRFYEHLQGRIAWVAATHPERGERLRAALDRVPSW